MTMVVTSLVFDTLFYALRDIHLVAIIYLHIS